MDGSGYPRYLIEDEIHLYQRIVGVADVFDALTSKRNYREALSYELAFQEIINESPQLRDGRVVFLLDNHIKRNKPTERELSERLKRGERYAVIHVSNRQYCYCEGVKPG